MLSRKRSSFSCYDSQRTPVGQSACPTTRPTRPGLAPPTHDRSIRFPLRGWPAMCPRPTAPARPTTERPCWTRSSAMRPYSRLGLDCPRRARCTLGPPGVAVHAASHGTPQSRSVPAQGIRRASARCPVAARPFLHRTRCPPTSSASPRDRWHGSLSTAHGDYTFAPPSNGRGPWLIEPFRVTRASVHTAWGSRSGALTVRHHHRRLENYYKFQRTPGASPRSLVDFPGSIKQWLRPCFHRITGPTFLRPDAGGRSWV